MFSSDVVLNAQEAVKQEDSKPPKEIESASLRNDQAIAKTLEENQIKWLKAGSKQFLGIFNEDISGAAKGSVLILPAPGNSPLADGLLPELASELSSHGWHSLAITLPELDFSGPVAAPDKEMPSAKDWYAKQQTSNMEKLLVRLLAAEAELQANKGQYVLLVQGTTAELVLELLSSNVLKAAGFISLNIRHPVYQRSSKIATNLAAVKTPILDLYNVSDGGNSSKRKARQQANELAGNYNQIYIPGNDINFRGSEQLLIKRVRSWLKKNYSKTE